MKIFALIVTVVYLLFTIATGVLVALGKATPAELGNFAFKTLVMFFFYIIFREEEL
jgi:hypothetical protein